MLYFITHNIIHLLLEGDMEGFTEKTYITKESDRLLRLPMYYSLRVRDVDEITDRIKSFLNRRIKCC